MGVLPLGGVLARPAAGQQSAQRRPDRHRPRGAGRAGLQPRRAARRRGRARPRQRRPRPAGRLLPRLARHAAHPGRRLRHPLRVRHLPPDLRGRLAGRAARRLARAAAIRGSSRTPRWRSTVGFGGHTEAVHDDRGRAAACAGARRAPCWASPTTTMVPGYRSGTVNTLRLWSAQATSAFDLQVFNAGDYTRAVAGQGRVREHHQGALPGGSAPRRAGSCAWSSSTSSSPARCRTSLRSLPARTCRSSGCPSGSSSSSTTPTRRIAVAELMRLLVDEYDLAWERGLGDHRAGLRLHLPHPAARGAGEVAGRRCSSRCCRATWRSSTGSTRASWPRCASASPATRPRRSACRSSRRSPSARSGWPTSPRSAASQVNGVAPLHSQPAPRAGAAATSPSSGPRSSPTSPTASRRAASCALANPRLADLITATHRRRLADRPGPAAASWSRYAEDAGVPGRAGARSSSGTSSCWPRIISERDRRHRATRRPVRRDGQAAARVQAPDAQAAARHHAVQPDQGRTRPADVVPRVVIFGAKAAPGYRDGQADHQADQRRRRRRQRRPGRRRPAQGRLPAQLQRHAGRAHLSRPPTSRSRSRWPARRRRAPAT